MEFVKREPRPDVDEANAVEHEIEARGEFEHKIEERGECLVFRIFLEMIIIPGDRTSCTQG